MAYQKADADRLCNGLRASTGNNDEVNLCDFYADGETNANLQYAFAKLKEAGIDINTTDYILMGDSGSAIVSTGYSTSANNMKNNEMR